MPLVNPKGHIQRYWSMGIFYERALMQEIWSRFGDRDLRRIYDVGACVGNHATWFALSWPGAVVYAFEPNAHACDVLARTVAMNGTGKRTMICPYALGSEVGRGTSVETGNEGMNVVMGGDDFGIYPIDTLAFAAPDLMKIDAEGMEHEILAGAHRTLETYHPALYIEGDRDALEHQLAPYGYRHVWTGCSTPTHGFVV